MNSAAWVGKRIRQARIDKGWTQQQLADALGLVQGAIGNYELGERDMAVSTLVEIAEALGRPIKFFLPALGQLRQHRAVRPDPLDADQIPDELEPIPNCDDWGTGEGRYHGRIG